MKKYIIVLIIVFYSCQNENDFRREIRNKIIEKNYDGAILDLKSRLKINSTDPEFFIYYYDLGSCYHSLRKYELALENYNNFFIKKKEIYSTYDSYDYVAYFDRGVVKYELGDFKGSLNDLDTAINIKPDDPSPYLSRAKARMKFGMRGKACDDMDFYSPGGLQILENKEDPLDQEFNNLYIEWDCEDLIGL